MDEHKFNWGIIGPGRIAHSFANGLSVIEEANLSAIASRNRDRADKFAEEFNPDKIYTSYLDLISDPEIDGIYIATPHRFHFEQAILALNNRKAVLCEKPITVNASELKRLVETARNKNVFLMEALWTRYLPIYNVVRAWLDDGIIGNVKLINSTFGFNMPRDLEDRKFNHELAGGALLDLGIYPVSISQWVMGKSPNKFSANGYLGETNVDEMIAVTLEYDNGSISQFSCNFLSKNENDFIIYGTKGYIRIHSMFWGSTKATLYTEDSVITESRPFRASGFEYQIEEAMNCIRKGLLESPRMPLEQSLQNIELLDSIRNEIGLKYSFEKN
jgi:predicted dehydrogenase